MMSVLWNFWVSLRLEIQCQLNLSCPFHNHSGYITLINSMVVNSVFRQVMQTSKLLKIKK